ncbi:cbb3-type cytochrome oxidase assembly protein CcoS [Anaerobacillus alkaliphilus]|nr:cbb3-type cytochrome oxidase assembly protein CcoS [Anaerobacillus alkaliphilus]
MNSVSTFLVFQGLFGLSMNAWILIIVMLSLSGAASFIFIGAKNSGQFDDVEGIKYRMLVEEEEELEFYD